MQFHDPVVSKCRSLAMPGAWCSRFRSSTDMTLQFVGQLHFLTSWVPRYWSLPPNKCKSRGTKELERWGSFSNALFFAQSLNMLAFRSDPSSPSLPRPPLFFIAFAIALFGSTGTGTPVLLALPAKSESTPTTHHHLPPPTTSAGHGWKSLTPAMDDSILKCPNPLHQNFMKRSI